MAKIEIAPSILSADFRCLEKEVKAATDAGADRIHCDVMDGVFVPNITFGPIVVEAVRKAVSIPLDVHLMIVHPEKYVKAFCDAGADILIVHAEACDNLEAVIDTIHGFGVRCGVSVNPDKPLELFLPLLHKIDQVLIMTVYAGFGGQKLMADMMQKVKTVYDRAKEIGKEIDIEVDGGVSDSTVVTCVQHGANVLVAGSYIFGDNDYREKIQFLRRIAENAANSIL